MSFSSPPTNIRPAPAAVSGSSSGLFFTIVFLPDTHVEIGSTWEWQHIYNWIVQNRVSHNIVAIVGEGDIVTDAWDSSLWTPEFDRATPGWAAFDTAGIPNIAAVGNHDYDTDASVSDRLTTRFEGKFPLTRMSGKSWYGGSYDDTAKNCWIKFDVEGRKFLVVALEIWPDDDMLTWALGVCNDNLDREVIFVTHSHLNPEGDLTESTDTFGSGTQVYETNDGPGVWAKLGKLAPNMKFIVSGHQYRDTEPFPKTAYLLDTGDNGNDVHQWFCNYQTVNSGDGMIGLLRFSTSSDVVDLSAYRTLSDRTDQATVREITWGDNYSTVKAAANARSINVGMALSHSNIPDTTVEDFIAANANYAYHYTASHWGSMFPTVGSISATNKANLDEVVTFLTGRGLTYRWHALTWEPNTPSDLETEATADLEGTLDTWFQWVADNYGDVIGPAGIDVCNETIDTDGIGYADGKLTRAGGTEAIGGYPLYIPKAIERARLIFPTKRLAITDYCTVQGSTTVYLANTKTSVFNLLDYLIAQGLKPDIWGEQGHLRIYSDAGDVKYDQDFHARYIQEFKDRGIRYNIHELDGGLFAGVTMDDATRDATLAPLFRDVFDVLCEMGCTDIIGTQGYVDDAGLTNHNVLYGSDYLLNTRGTAALKALRTRPVITGPSYPYLSNYSVLEPGGVVGTLSAINPDGASLTYSIVGTPTGGSLSITGGTTLNASGLDFDVADTIVSTIRVSDGTNHYDWDPDKHQIEVTSAANLFAPGLWAGSDKEGWTTPASVKAEDGLVFTATPVGQQARKAFDYIDGHRYLHEYDLQNNPDTGTFGGRFRMDLSGTVTGTNRTAAGHYTDTLTASSSTELWLRSVVSAFTGRIVNLVVTDLDA